MLTKRYLTNEELNKIRNEEDLLKGNINRMCVCDDSTELIKMYSFALLRINKIYDICSCRFIEGGKNNEK